MDRIHWWVREFITVRTSRIQANKMLHPDDTNKKPERVGVWVVRQRPDRRPQMRWMDGAVLDRDKGRGGHSRSGE